MSWLLYLYVNILINIRDLYRNTLQTYIYETNGVHVCEEIIHTQNQQQQQKIQRDTKIMVNLNVR